jgi:transcriptional regulator with XRE-family HTH domain
MNHTIGKNLHRLRKKKNMSQTEIANMLDLHQTAICRIEQGIQELTANQLFVLVKLFKVCFDEFYKPS